MKDSSAKRQSNEEAVNMRHELILILKSDHLGEALWRCVYLLNLMYSHNAYPMFFGFFFVIPCHLKRSTNGRIPSGILFCTQILKDFDCS